MAATRNTIISAVLFATGDFMGIYDNILNDTSDEESDSNSDTEIVEFIASKLKPRKKVPVRIQNYFGYVIPNYTEREFQSHFRMTRTAFDALLPLIMPQLKRRGLYGRPRSEIEKKVLAVLWILATPDSFRSVGDRFDLGKSSMSDTFMRVIEALNRIAPLVIKWPSNEEFVAIENSFTKYGGLHGVRGAVDGTYVPIKAPKRNPETYITRKSCYAMTLQCVAIPSLKFIDSFMGYPGSVNDNRIFRNSPLHKKVTRNVADYFQDNTYIIGDKSYPILLWCMPPFINRGRLTPAQTYFNTQHASTRQVIERSFALLFGRFRRLKFLDMNRTDKIPSAVLACCVLHNICLDSADLFNEDYIREGLEFVHENINVNNNEIENVEILDRAVNFRNAVANNLFYRIRNNQ